MDITGEDKQKNKNRTTSGVFQFSQNVRQMVEVYRVHVVSFISSQFFQFWVLYASPNSDGNHMNLFNLVDQMDVSEYSTPRNDNAREPFAVASRGVTRRAKILVITIKNFHLL